MKRFLLAGVAALALTGCTAFEDGAAPAPGSALSRVADRLAAGGDAATAAALYRSSIALGNNGPDVRRGYANALLALGDARAAIEQYEAALAQAKDARIYNGLGVAYDMLGDHERAQEQFRAGLALAPDNKGLIHNYGLSLAAATAPAPATAGEPKAASAPEKEPALSFAPEAASKPASASSPAPVSAAPAEIPPSAAAEPQSGISPATEPVATPAAEVALAITRAPLVSATPEPAVAPMAQLASVVTGEAAPAQGMLMPKPNEIVPLGKPTAMTPVYGDYYRVRLAGYATRERALAFRHEIELRSPELHNAVRVVAERTSLALKARLRYTLVSAPLPSRDAADLACGALIARGLACRTEPASSPLMLRL